MSRSKVGLGRLVGAGVALGVPVGAITCTLAVGRATVGVGVGWQAATKKKMASREVGLVFNRQREFLKLQTLAFYFTQETADRCLYCSGI